MCWHIHNFIDIHPTGPAAQMAASRGNSGETGHTPKLAHIPIILCGCDSYYIFACISTHNDSFNNSLSTTDYLVVRYGCSYKKGRDACLVYRLD